MKVALVHDYIKEYGGAERVLEVLHEMFPDADVYTLIYLPKYLGPHRERFRNWKIYPSVLQRIPMKGKMVSMFRFIDHFIFRAMDLSKYDLVIVSKAGTYSGVNSFKKSKKTRHVCYCHTPPRYLYGYATANKWNKGFIRKFLLGLGQIPMHFIRLWDYKDAQIPDLFIANSKEVKERIRKFYRRDAVVVYPPVTAGISKTENRISKGKKDSNSINDIPHSTYYLAGGRLARAKRVDLAVEACTKLKIPLKVFGKSFAGYGDELRGIAGSNVEFLGEVSEKEKFKLMTGAKGFIFPSDTEDFGITPVEAMMMGTPVIVYKSGGVLETVVEGKTGLFFAELNINSLIDAISRFERMKWNKEEIVKNSKRFSKDRFITAFKKTLIKSGMN